MKLKAEIALSRAVLESLTDEDLRWIEAEVSRRMEQIYQVATDGWATSGSDRALERIIELTTVHEINNRPTSDPKLSP